jgi:hypothetical protein
MYSAPRRIAVTNSPPSALPLSDAVIDRSGDAKPCAHPRVELRVELRGGELQHAREHLPAS